MFDTPIISDAQDVLGHSAIAEYLSAFVSKPKSDAGVIVALTGPWGSGKSGILNLTCNRLKTKSIAYVNAEGVETSMAPSVFHFQPWLVGARDSLIASFFAELIKEIDRLKKEAEDSGTARLDEIQALADKLRKQIQNFAKLASAAAEAAQFIEPTGLGALIAAGLSFFGKIGEGVGIRSLETERKAIESLV